MIQRFAHIEVLSARLALLERCRMNKESFKEKSYWMTTREYAPGDPLQGDIDVDVAIVGGDFTGLFRQI